MTQSTNDKAASGQRSEIISEYYDRFSLRKLSKDFDHVNPRQAAAIKLCKKFLVPTDHVLEIGCGVGIVTRELSGLAASVIALDISEANIELTKLVAANKNVECFKCDVIDKDEFNLITGGKLFDDIVMIDAIEHIPIVYHSILLEKLQSALAPGGRLIFTFPSPEYQNFIHKNEPENVQIVDEVVYARDLLNYTDLRPIYISNINIWRKDQYIHLVLKKSGPEDLQLIPSPTKFEFKRFTMEFLWRFRNRRIRKIYRDLNNKQ